MYLFCYGSNHPAQLRERLGWTRMRKTEAAWLPGYGRVFRGFSRRWQGGVATVVKDSKRTVYGYIAKVTDADLALMDEYEGAAYSRVLLRLQTHESGEVDAVAYVRNIKSGLSAPSRAYLEAIVKTISSHWGGNITVDDIVIA